MGCQQGILKKNIQNCFFPSTQGLGSWSYPSYSTNNSYKHILLVSPKIKFLHWRQVITFMFSLVISGQAPHLCISLKPPVLQMFNNTKPWEKSWITAVLSQLFSLKLRRFISRSSSNKITTISHLFFCVNNHDQMGRECGGNSKDQKINECLSPSAGTKYLGI